MSKTGLVELFERAATEEEIQAILDGLSEAISLLEGGDLNDSS